MATICHLAPRHQFHWPLMTSHKAHTACSNLTIFATEASHSACGAISSQCYSFWHWHGHWDLSLYTQTLQKFRACGGQVRGARALTFGPHSAPLTPSLRSLSLPAVCPTLLLARPLYIFIYLYTCSCSCSLGNQSRVVGILYYHHQTVIPCSLQGAPNLGWRPCSSLAFFTKKLSRGRTQFAIALWDSILRPMLSNSPDTAHGHQFGQSTFKTRKIKTFGVPVTISVQFWTLDTAYTASIHPKFDTSILQLIDRQHNSLYICPDAWNFHPIVDESTTQSTSL